MSTQAILAIDEGTTNLKAILVTEDGRILASHNVPLDVAYLKSGWVEQDANAIWKATQDAIKGCLDQSPNVGVIALGISNQRESIVLWDRKTGEPLGPVVSWQCRRTAPQCDQLREAGHEPEVIAKTGLPLDPMFPPTKAAWLLGHHASEHQADEVCLGTVDSWLIWCLSNGKVHATDRSNAARTQLFNLSDGCWDEGLCALFGVSEQSLPKVFDSSNLFGVTENTGIMPDDVPIASAIGDSHAALFGHGAFNKGDGKVTFGTGSSMMSTIPAFIEPPKGITTTIAWSLNGQSTYAFEGNILVSAAILPWTAKLLDLESVDELLELAQSAGDNLGVALVPAHVGLGSPHWNSDVRGLISGLNFSVGREQVALAAAQSIALQIKDIYDIMSEAAPQGIGNLFVDGRPSQNTFLMQIVADLIDHPVIPGKSAHASALGAAWLAGLAVGYWSDLVTISQRISHDEKQKPTMNTDTREAILATWQDGINKTLGRVV